MKGYNGEELDDLAWQNCSPFYCQQCKKLIAWLSYQGQIEKINLLFCDDCQGMTFKQKGRTKMTDIRITDCKHENKQLKEKAEKLDCIEAYVRILQDGDPENEDPKKILDETARFIESEM